MTEAAHAPIRKETVQSCGEIVVPHVHAPLGGGRRQMPRGNETRKEDPWQSSTRPLTCFGSFGSQQGRSPQCPPLPRHIPAPFPCEDGWFSACVAIGTPAFGGSSLRRRTVRMDHQTRKSGRMDPQTMHTDKAKWALKQSTNTRQNGRARGIRGLIQPSCQPSDPQGVSEG